MRRWRKGRRVERKRFDHGAPIAKIDTRPMVFVVMFVALVHLVLASQTRPHSILLDLYSSGQPYYLDEHGDDGQILSIAANGQLYWDDQAVSRNQLTSALEHWGAQKSRREIWLHPNPQAPYGDVAEVIRRLWLNRRRASFLCLSHIEPQRKFANAAEHLEYLQETPIEEFGCVPAIFATNG